MSECKERLRSCYVILVLKMHHVRRFEMSLRMLVSVPELPHLIVQLGRLHGSNVRSVRLRYVNPVIW